jgi:hypothetical protein
MTKTERTVWLVAAVRPSELLGRQHVVEFRDREVAVGNDRIGDLGALRLLDVVEPARMAVDGIDAEADQLCVAAGELGLDLGHVAELGRANTRRHKRVLTFSILKV